eukprot:8579276-Lingulodinium_polyedra.AAC.1
MTCSRRSPRCSTGWPSHGSGGPATDASIGWAAVGTVPRSGSSSRPSPGRGITGTATRAGRARAPPLSSPPPATPPS